MLLALCLAITCKRRTGPMNKHMFSGDVRGNRTLLICLNSINVRSDIRRWHLNNIEAGLDGVQLVFRSNSCQVFYGTTFLGRCLKIPRKHPPWKYFSVNLQPFVLKTLLKLTPPGLSFFEFFEAFLEKLLNGVETIAPEENCLPDNYPPDNWPSDECLEDNKPRTMYPWTIAPKGNCLSDWLLPA